MKVSSKCAAMGEELNM